MAEGGCRHGHRAGGFLAIDPTRWRRGAAGGGDRRWTPLGGGQPASAALSLPSGFQETVLASNKFFAPTLFTFTPAGNPLVSQQNGKLKLLKNGVVSNFLELTVNSTTDRGVLGVAFDPNFATTPYVYVYYHRPTTPVHGVISRFTVQGDVALAATETVLYTMDDLALNGLHTGGAMEFGADGKLYVSVGDDARGNVVSQSLSSDLGKILRINKDGSIPTDNPFFTQATGKYRSIWAFGLRNPYTWAFDQSGRMIINEVGLDTWEELNRGSRGGQLRLAHGQRRRPATPASPTRSTPTTTAPATDEGCAGIGGDFADAEHVAASPRPTTASTSSPTSATAGSRPTTRRRTRSPTSRRGSRARRTCGSGPRRFAVLHLPDPGDVGRLVAVAQDRLHGRPGSDHRRAAERRDRRHRRERDVHRVGERHRAAQLPVAARRRTDRRGDPAELHAQRRDRR